MKNKNIIRKLERPLRSFFLFGPRGTGKSTWLRQIFKNDIYIDLLDTSLFLELSQTPGNLKAIIGEKPFNSWIVIDEIQKIPALLDEVHRLIESNDFRFALSGSSARKLRKEGVNLLAGRAVTRHFFPFSFNEIKLDNYDLTYSLEWGMLPLIQTNKSEAQDLLMAYVDTYIKEEIREEGIVRKLAPFLRFLNIAGLLNGQTVNSQNIARESSVPRGSIDSYFSILQDTLLGDFLPAYRPNIKVREQTHPKFFWFDPGIARAAAGLLHEPADRIWLGAALETLILHELKFYNQLIGRYAPVFYYKTPAGSEIDFVIETRKRRLNTKPQVVCIEVKLSEKWNRKWEKSIRSLNESNNIEVVKMIGIYTGKREYLFDKFEVLPLTIFFNKLFNGEIFS